MSDADNIERDSDLWFDDGNIVFIAQSVAFRVHKSILARHSEVFAGLFAVPQPPPMENPGHTFDGVPSVHVSDSNYDFRTLVRALYGEIGYVRSPLYKLCGLHPPCHSTIDPQSAPPFPVLAALARMSHKYQISHILEAVTSSLKRIFPSKLDLWDDLPSEIENQALEAVNLFRLLDRPDMLVPALYDCCRLPARTVVRGAPRADGTHECLAPEDVELCWDVRCALVKRDAHVTLRSMRMFWPATCECAEGAEECTRKIENYLQIYRENVDIVDDNPLDDSFTDSAEELMEDYGVCESCAEELDKRAESLRREVWDDLPEIMGLKVEGWG